MSTCFSACTYECVRCCFIDGTDGDGWIVVWCGVRGRVCGVRGRRTCPPVVAFCFIDGLRAVWCDDDGGMGSLSFHNLLRVIPFHKPYRCAAVFWPFFVRKSDRKYKLALHRCPSPLPLHTTLCSIMTSCHPHNATAVRTPTDTHTLAYRHTMLRSSHIRH